MPNLDVRFVYGELSQKEKNDVIKMWTNAGVVAFEEAIRRVEQVSVLVLDDKKIVGVGTSYIDKLPQNGDAYFFFRMFIEPKHRGSNLIRTKVGQLNFHGLKKLYENQINGMVIELENIKLARLGENTDYWIKRGYTYYGKSARGLQLWYVRFDEPKGIFLSPQDKEPLNKNILWHNQQVTKAHRAKHTRQKPCILWFTGLSGSGKSTIANALEEILYNNGNFTYLLDGDNIRHGLNSGLGFDDTSRVENIRRVGEVAKLFVDSGQILLSAFISPFANDRERVKNLVEADEFIEIFIDTPLKVCESRDPKGLYEKARNGEIPNFTGISSPYEAPIEPEVHIQTDKLSIEECADRVIEYLDTKGYLSC